MSSEDLPPQIIKKIKKSHGGHGGAWKVAYADFVTAMMALFIVLWVMSQSAKVQKMVANYFKNPIGFSNKSASLLNGDNLSVLKVDNKSDQQSAVQAHVREMEMLKEMGERLLGELSKDPTFKNITNQIKIEFVNEGLRIEIVESAKEFFFEIGTAKLTPQADLLLRKIGDQLAKLPNKITIEGHTDARPYSNDGKGYTNFELSADRANAARRALIESSLKDSQIFSVKGYADRVLRDKSDPYNFVNRRISIIVKYSDYNQ
jgi:chemotaxis protein MotB